VASRLPLIAHQFEANVTHDAPRAKFAIPYANFMKIHYRDLKVMPGDEPDGCEPEVSTFEIASQSWESFDLLFRQTGDAQWQVERDKVEKLALARQPATVTFLTASALISFVYRFSLMTPLRASVWGSLAARKSGAIHPLDQ